MAKQERDFYQRDPEDQAAFLEQTWCNNCLEVDLGMVDPVEYEQDGTIMIEGKCKKCGESVITELADEEDDSEWID
ncbi:hypothetical protein NBRC116188_02380 [Oceaniserpentilla sp. 4NH20-0058]|uniref:hypothetical protein n=1 Tax=Oceaniserpentilla sp. 4NH20-0058 TaxID=3127660 RepID=UPI003107CD93